MENREFPICSYVFPIFSYDFAMISHPCIRNGGPVACIGGTHLGTHPARPGDPKTIKSMTPETNYRIRFEKGGFENVDH